MAIFVHGKGYVLHGLLQSLRVSTTIFTPVDAQKKSALVDQKEP